MEKETVIKFRNLAKQLTCTLYSKELNKDGEHDKLVIPADIHIVCDNSLNAIDDHLGSVQWDDDNEVFYIFRLNTQSAYYQGKTNTISTGDQPAIPICLIAVDYGEIQNMRFQLNREQFEKALVALNIPEDEGNYLRDKFFLELNQAYLIKKKREISYDTQTRKDGEIAKRSYDDRYEYDMTMHPMAW